MKIIVVTGMSGAGRTTALHMFEDLGYSCIDNIPLAMLRPLNAKTLLAGDERYELLALGMDSRATTEEIDALPKQLESLREHDIEVSLLFLDADDEVLIRRYNETRRRHPHTDKDTSLKEAIAREREILKPVAALADLRIDTSRRNLHQLREKIRRILIGTDSDSLSILFQSFGFKFGVPDGVDYVFDVRCLPNPHWQESLRPLTGMDEGVIRFLAEHGADEMVDDIASFLLKWLPRHEDQDRAYVTVAIGCTGGRHRSVRIVEQLVERFRPRYQQVLVRHTELQ